MGSIIVSKMDWNGVEGGSRWKNNTKTIEAKILHFILIFI